MKIFWLIFFVLIVNLLNAQLINKKLYYSNPKIDFYKLYFLSYDYKLGSTNNSTGESLYLFNEENLVVDTLFKTYCNNIIPIDTISFAIQGISDGGFYKIKNGEIITIKKTGIFYDKIEGRMFTCIEDEVFFVRAKASKENKKYAIYHLVDGNPEFLFNPKKKVVNEKYLHGLLWDFKFANNCFYYFDFKAQVLNSYNIKTEIKNSMQLPFTKNIYWEMLIDHVAQKVYFIKSNKDNKAKSLYQFIKNNDFVFVKTLDDEHPIGIFDSNLIFQVKSKSINEFYTIELDPKAIKSQTIKLKPIDISK